MNSTQIRHLLFATFLIWGVTYFYFNKKRFNNILSNSTNIGIIFSSIIMMVIFECFIRLSINLFADTKNKKIDDRRNRMRKLRKLIEEHDDNDTAHIILGDYDSEVERNTDYKVVNINHGNKFLIPFSDAYKNEKDLSIILETNGGDVDSSDMIFRSLIDYPHNVKVYIVNYAFSAGTFITLACKKIFMAPWALLGPTDPQLSCEPEDSEFYTSSRHFMDMMNNKENDVLSERMYMTSNEAKLYHEENISYAREGLRKSGHRNKDINKITDELCSGKYSHGKPFNSRMLKDIGLNVNDDIPDHIFKLNKNARRFLKK